MDVARRFIDALETLERDWIMDDLVSLFSDQCELGNIVSPNVFFGRQGAQDYWSVYRNWFGEVESSIHRVISTEQQASIEWSSRGMSATGVRISYEGVTILEFHGDQISRYRAYFNPTNLARGVPPGHSLATPFEVAFSKN